MMNTIILLNVENCSTSGNAPMKQHGKIIHNSTSYLTESKCVIYCNSYTSIIKKSSLVVSMSFNYRLLSVLLF